MVRDWIRSSSVAAWSQCPRMARLHRESEDRHVGAVVGTLAHAQVAGETKVDIPSRIWTDTITPTLQDARMQAKIIANRITHALHRDGYTVTERELELEDPDLRVRGHVDAIGMRGDRPFALDIKTGRELGTAWLQLGAYAHLLEVSGKGVQDVCVVHLPRAKVEKIGVPDIQVRDAGPVVDMFRTFLQGIDALHAADAQDMATPGPHCRLCRLACSVRPGEGK